MPGTTSTEKSDETRAHGGHRRHREDELQREFCLIFNACFFR